jgi:Putative restriction endonuclease
MQVVLNPPEHVIAERCRLGLDRHDEVWGGNYYMVPPANNEHQRLGGKLLLIFWPLAEARGLEYRYESGLYVPLADPANWCVPDQLAYRPEHGSYRGVEGRAELVIEFRSPGDDAIRKIPFYERVGVAEMLVIDRDTKALRHWVRQGEGLVETDETVVSLAAFPARLWRDGDILVVETSSGTTRI